MKSGQKLQYRAKQLVTESLQNDEGGSIFYEEGLRYSPRVDANRGASGIDGVLSTAVGFAAGIKRPATLLIGDLSFLHDTNGLSLLSHRPGQPPLTVVVVNNKGGGIFSLLPVAETLPENTFTMLFSTPQDVSLESLCRAHRVNYCRVSSRFDLEEALSVAKRAQVHWVVEVPGAINENTRVHRELQEVARNAADQILSLSKSFSGSLQNSSIISTVSEVHLRHYRLPLLASPSVSSRQKQNKSTNVEISKPREREGIIIRLVLANGVEGFGEVAPLPGLHNETLGESEEQLRMFAYDLKGISLSLDLAMLSGAFDSWFFRELGCKPEDIYPSVRCGIEMAVLNALANSSHSTKPKFVPSGKQTGYLSLSDLLLCNKIPQSSPDSVHSPSSSISTTPPLSTSKISAVEFTSKLNENLEGEISDSSCNVDEINPEEDNNMFVFSAALIDSEGSPSEVASEALDLTNLGFRTLKLKVARRSSPAEDAKAILAVRAAVGPKVNLRVDANRRWNLMEAKAFAKQVEKANLQFIEEPVNNPKALKAFYASTGLPFALDESLDDGLIGPGVVASLDVGRDSGLAAVVIKPSVIGGFERSSSIIRWAFSEGIKVVISSAFESSIALAAYTELAHFSNICCNQEWKAFSNEEGGQSSGSTVGDRERRNSGSPDVKIDIFDHGLGTFAWLAVDTVQESQSFRRGNVMGRKGDKENGQLGILLKSTRTLLKEPVFGIGSDVRVDEKLLPEIEKVEVGNYIYNLCVYDTESLRSKTAAAKERKNTSSGKIEPLKLSQNDNDCEISFPETSENKDLFNDTKESQKNLSDCPTLVFLHGFLGSSEDWFPIIRSLETPFRCIAIDIPGQGLSRVEKRVERDGRDGRDGKDRDRQNFGYNNEEKDEIRNELQMEAIGEALMQTITEKTKGRVIVIGYSMGARVALYLSMKFTEKVAGAVIISGSPGIRAVEKRSARAAQDDALAKSLRTGGLEKFVDSWYKRPLWKSLSCHPMFSAIKARRIENWKLLNSGKINFTSPAEDAADILSALSTGRQPSLWENISSCPTRLLLIVGSLDKKFVSIAQEMRAEWQPKKETKGTSIQTPEDWQDMLDFNPSFNSTLNPGLRSPESEQTSWETFFEQEMKRMQLEDALEAEPGVHTEMIEDELEAPEDKKTQFDHVDIVEVEGVGHAVHIEAKLKVLEAIRVFALQ